MDDHKAAWEAYFADRSIENRNRLADIYRPLVVGIAHMQAKKNTSYDPHDLAQDGMFGLFQAIERYDPSREEAFSTFAYPRIYGSIIDAIRKCDWVPRVARAREEPVPNLGTLNYVFGYDDTGAEITYEDILPDHRVAPPWAKTHRRWLRKLIRRRLRCKEATVILLYYFRHLTMKKIADRMGYSESYVSITRAAALMNLKKELVREQFSH